MENKQYLINKFIKAYEKYFIKGEQDRESYWNLYNAWYDLNLKYAEFFIRESFSYDDIYKICKEQKL